MTACSSCRFYRGATVGACYRYPSPTRVSSSHWCGEFASVDVPAVMEYKTDKKTGRKFVSVSSKGTKTDV